MKLEVGKSYMDHQDMYTIIEATEETYTAFFYGIDFGEGCCMPTIIEEFSHNILECDDPEQIESIKLLTILYGV